MLRLACLMLVVVSLLAAGCGDSLSGAPSLTRPAVSHKWRTLRYPQEGLSITIPRGWLLARAHRPLVTVAGSGNAVIALWRYVRSAPVPAGAGLTEARRALIAAVRSRQPGAQILSSRAIVVDGYPAIVLETLARISGLERHIRSAHIYAPGEEIVLEEYAPASEFGLVSRSVFVPVRRSLKIASF